MSSLAVPMQLDALVVSPNVLARDTFRWWPFNYLSLGHWRSPEPLALDRSVGGQKPGVYLAWTLPEALRHAPDGSGFPPVPNRWLIVRTSGADPRTANAWVLESDCPFTSKVTTSDSAQSSMYLVDPELIAAWKRSADPIRKATSLDPVSTDIQVAKIGVAFPLSGWNERDATTTFLTAVAPSNPLFATYVAHNLGVFSFWDDCAGLDDATLSYFVLGWYSDPTKDIVAGGASDARLKELGWSVHGGSSGTTTRSVCHGAAFGVPWSRSGAPPADDPLQAIRDSGKLDVGIGNTSIDALTALIAKQLGDPRKAELLRAFQYDALDALNQPDGAALLADTIRQAAFGSRPGGYTWTIVDSAGDGTTVVTPSPSEQAWLSTLNRDQAALDDALAQLWALQREVHALWLKRGFLSDAANTLNPPDGISDLSALTAFKAQLADALDTTRSGSPIARLVAQFAQVQALRGRVPQPDRTGTTNAHEALQSGIREFAAKKRLDPSRTLKMKAAPRYWRTSDPVVIRLRRRIADRAVPRRPDRPEHGQPRHRLLGGRRGDRRARGEGADRRPWRPCRDRTGGPPARTGIPAPRSGERRRHRDALGRAGGPGEGGDGGP